MSRIKDQNSPSATGLPCEPFKAGTGAADPALKEITEINKHDYFHLYIYLCYIFY